MVVLQKKKDTNQLHSTYSHMERENTAACCENKDMRYLMQELQVWRYHQMKQL